MFRRISIDYASFFERGFSGAVIPAKYYSRIMKSISEINWVKDSINKSYNLIPDFNLHEADNIGKTRAYGESDIALRTMERFPADAKQAVIDMLNDPDVMGVLIELYNARLDFIDIWDGVEDGLGWHCDKPCAADITGLMYLDVSDENGAIDESYGGGLEVGIRRLEEGVNWNNHYNNIQSLGVVVPNRRTQMWVNNMNPMFVHRPIPLADPNTKRLTITFGVCLEEK